MQSYNQYATLQHTHTIINFYFIYNQIYNKYIKKLLEKNE